MLATLAEGGVPGSLDRSQVSGYMDELPTIRGRSASPTMASSRSRY
jgi:hypothetical protein